MRRFVMGMVVLLAASCAEAQTLDTYRASVNALLSGTFARQDGYTLANPNASLGFTMWPGRRVVDDGTPTSVQAFLQHPDDLGASVSGYGTWGNQDDGSYSVTGSYLGVSVGGGHWFGSYYVGASVLAGRYVTTVLNTAVSAAPSTTHLDLLQPGLTLAYHFDTSEIDVRYALRLRWDDNGQEPTNWGSVSASMTTVFDNETEVVLTVYTLDGGGLGGSGFFEEFLTRRLGIFFSGGYQSGTQFVDSSDSYNNIAMSAGIGWWLNGSVKLEPTLSLNGNEQNANGASRFWTEAAIVSLDWRIH